MDHDSRVSVLIIAIHSNSGPVGHDLYEHWSMNYSWGPPHISSSMEEQAVNIAWRFSKFHHHISDRDVSNISKADTIYIP